MMTWEDDFTFSNHGSVWLCTANNELALKHLRENVSEDAIWWAGDSVGVEPRYVPGLVEALQGAGFSTNLG